MSLINTIKSDRSAVNLLASNLVTILFALIQRWSVTEVMFIYWCQSVIIGLFNFRRILSLKQFSTENFRISNRPVEPTKATQRKTAWFFLVHYGFFHLGYLIFILSMGRSFTFYSWGLLVCVGTFLVNHRFSFLYNLEEDLNRKPNIGSIMFFPYARIVPMHLTIIFGSMFAEGSALKLILFLSLKTCADIFMHLIEHQSLPFKPSFAKK